MKFLKPDLTIVFTLGMLFFLAGCAGADPNPAGESPENSFSEDINALYFIDGREGWAAGDRGFLLHTDNGGATWQARQLETTRDLHDVFFVDSHNGWIVGEGGLILKTISAGLGWVRQESNSLEDLNAVQFLNPNVGWAVGENGTILFSTNGGLLWTPQPGGELHSFNDVFFRDVNTGWIVGDRGVIMFTREGARGGFWDLQISGTTRNLNSIHWNGANAFVAGAEGVVLKTAFGYFQGEGRWDIQPPMVNTGSMSQVFFINRTTGWVVNRTGVVIHTNDEGLTWMDRSPTGGPPLNAVFFNSPEVGWAAGDDGLILHSVDGGLFWIRQRVY